MDTVQPEVATIVVSFSEPEARRQLVRRFETEGYFVHQRDRDLSLIDLARDLQPTLIIRDARDDIEDEVQQLRRADSVPLILLNGSAAHDASDLLDLGADDVITQPCSTREVVARARATLRRVVGPPRAPTLSFPGLDLDLKARSVETRKGLVDLSRREFDLLVFFARHPGQVLTRGQLLTHVWSSDPSWQSQATVTEHVRRVRSRLGPASDGHDWIETVRGVGYRFRA